MDKSRHEQVGAGPPRWLAICVSTVGAVLGLDSLLLRESCDNELGCWVEIIGVASSCALSCWCMFLHFRRNEKGPFLLLGQISRSCLQLRKCMDFASSSPLSGLTEVVAALFCGALVAILGWGAMLGRPHIALMAMMQANATFCAWSACSTQIRADEEDRRSVVEKQHLCPSGCGKHRRVQSSTLPRGWRYHRSSGLFEHKRTGRMQYEPPSTGETGSPLHADLPPCDEETAMDITPELVRPDVPFIRREKSYADEIKISSLENASRSMCGRSNPWERGFSTPNLAALTSSASMNMWELRAALSEQGHSECHYERLRADQPLQPLGGAPYARISSRDTTTE